MMNRQTYDSEDSIYNANATHAWQRLVFLIATTHLEIAITFNGFLPPVALYLALYARF
jgi:hypothetical protein